MNNLHFCHRLKSVGLQAASDESIDVIGHGTKIKLGRTDLYLQAGARDAASGNCPPTKW